MTPLGIPHKLFERPQNPQLRPGENLNLHLAPLMNMFTSESGVAI